jgi:anti-sigma regulatory factor (Ser/Thr protein kinase)
MIPWLLSKIPKEVLLNKGENKIEVAFDELLTNIYEHGYKTKPYPIFLKVTTQDMGVLFEIRDMGPKFNPLNYEKINDDAEMQVGGHGIKFIKAAFKNLSYENKNGFNIISFQI